MKIKIESTIPTASAFENIKTSYEEEIPWDESVDGIENVRTKLKFLILKDLKEYCNIREKCICTPTWDNDNKKHIHADSCLMGTKRSER